MTTENTTDELNAEQEDAEFEAGFTGQEVEPADTEKESAEAEQTETTDETTEADTESQEAHPEETGQYGLTNDQIKALLAKASEVDAMKAEMVANRDRIFGKFGEIQRTLQDMRQSNAPASVAAKFTADKFKRLQKDFPELAEAFAADLSEAMSVETGNAQNPDEFNARLGHAVQSLRAEYDQKLDQRLAMHTMTTMRPNWRSEIASDDFALYRNTQMTPEAQQVWDTTWNPDEVAAELKKFDAWKERGTTKKVANKSRLEAALQPRGQQTEHSVSDDAAFEAGFKSVRSKRL